MKLACFSSFHPQPVTVDSLAFSEELQLVAEGLADGSIRLLDSKNMATIGSIPSSKTRSVRRILFFKNYMISCGVHGSVSMWDLATLVEVSSVESSQGAVWDMALSGDKLYLATETGSVVVVDVSNGELRVSHFLRTSSKATRALSVCVESDYLFVGDARGTISRWKLGSSSCDSTFSVPTKNELPTLVWSLVSCGNGHVVSGDSLGCVTLWDAKSCTLVQARQDHQADILVMHLNGSDLFCAGVDARVSRYQLSNDKLNFVSISAVMSRDISALTSVGEAVIVGGSDARLGVASTTLPAKFSSYRLDRFSNLATVASNTVACQDGASLLKLYRVSPDESNVLIAELDNVDPIAAFATNDDASIIVMAGPAVIRTLTISNGQLAEKSKIPVSGTVTSVAVSDRFTVVAIAGRELLVIEDGKKAVHIDTEGHIVTRMRLAGTTLVASSRSQILTAKLGTKTTPTLTRIDLESTVTAVSEIRSDRVFAATADHRIHTVDVGSVKIVSKKTLQGKLKLATFNHINSIVVDEASVALFGESFILTADVKDNDIVSSFRFNSAVATGGVVVGSGPLLLAPALKKKKSATTEEAKTAMAVIASFKTMGKSLISPFERKQFQK